LHMSTATIAAGPPQKTIQRTLGPICLSLIVYGNSFGNGNGCEPDRYELETVPYVAGFLFADFVIFQWGSSAKLLFLTKMIMKIGRNSFWQFSFQKSIVTVFLKFFCIPLFYRAAQIKRDASGFNPTLVTVLFIKVTMARSIIGWVFHKQLYFGDEMLISRKISTYHQFHPWFGFSIDESFPKSHLGTFALSGDWGQDGKQHIAFTLCQRPQVKIMLGGDG